MPIVVAESQSMRGPPTTLVELSLSVPVTFRSTASIPTSPAFVTVASIPVNVVVPLRTTPSM